MAVGATVMGIAGIVKAGVDWWSAKKNRDQAQQQYDEQKKIQDEEKNKAEQERLEQERKQKAVEDRYRGMRTNLYSSTGVAGTKPMSSSDIYSTSTNMGY